MLKKRASNTSRIFALAKACAISVFSFAIITNTATADTIVMNDLTVEYTGATASWIGGHLVLAYSNATEQGTLKLPGKATAHILLVGGGGAGGSTTMANSNSYGAGGGGGAGGFVESLNRVMVAGDYTITVGAGGAAATAAAVQAGADGGASSIADSSGTLLIAYGGGGGGAKSAGRAGASGGGGSYSGSAAQGGESTNLSQGNAGGTGTVKRYAGGGGGAGAVGNASTSSASGAGGAGKISYILSQDMATGGTYFAGGGGGGRYSGTTPALGTHGGGNGGYAANLPTAGVDGTGGGGGGGSRNVGAKGGDGVVIVRIAELLDTVVVPPTKPADATLVDDVWEIEWDGNNHIIYPETSLAYILLGEASGKDAGEYEFTVTLNEDFTWANLSGPAATAPITVKWRIKQASNYIQNLTIRKWEVGALPNAPQCEVRYGTPVYSYRLKSLEDIEENYSLLPPTEEGEYVLRAVVNETGNWARAEAKCDFIVFTGALDIHTDYVSYEIAANTAATLPVSNFPVRVVLKENDPYGFSHDDAVVDGVNTVRFYDRDSGEPLSFTNETWNVSGTSVFYVKVPEITVVGANILVYWGVKEGKTPVAVDATDTWSDFTRDEATNQSAYVNKVTFGLVTNAADQKYKNYFISVPRMNKTDWYLSDEVQGMVVSVGELADGGAITNYFVNRYTGAEYANMPQEAGAYAAVFAPVDTSMCYEFDYTIEFMIRDRSPQTDILSGGGGNNGRVLLMNDDTNALCRITNQGYQRSSPTTSTWWDFDVTGDTLPASSYYINLKKGYEFKLRTKGSEQDKGEILWNLINCRHGNTFRDNNVIDGMVTTENYLPWSATSRNILNSLQPAGNQTARVGNLVMRNMATDLDGSGAVVYSKLFDDGIGTIYFDAVNQITAATEENCALKVYYATTCKDGVTLPTDDNVELTNNYSRADWKEAQIFALKRDGTLEFKSEPYNATGGTNEFSLLIKNGGTTNNFYRVYVPLNIKGPVRFKIERTKAAPSSQYRPDDGNFIILDNIIVSKPAMYAELMPYGTNDTTKVGKEITGWAGAMTVAFPSATDKLYARAAVNAYTNDLADVANAKTFITSAKMYYRWRYLEQRATPDFGREWYSLELNPGNDFKAFEPMNLPGGVGDVEFYYSGTIQAPYYKYVDYSGTGLGVPGYTEEITDFKTGFSSKMEDNAKARADWFVRLREGVSEYEALKIEYKFGESGAVQTNVMEVIKNHTWRGYVQTPTNNVGNFYYRVHGVNRQENGATEFVTNDVIWGDQFVTNSVPVTGSLVEREETDTWSNFYNDAKTGYLMFQIDDRTLGLTIVHADYQDFNKWNDAASSELQLFVGRDDETEKRIGVSSTQKTYLENFDTWLDMPAESPRWLLSFPTGSQFTAASGYPSYQTFADNWYNGWDIKQGMWVAERYRDTSSGAALQMEGCGRGGVEYVQTPSPRGIDAIRFNARLGQNIEFENFAYYDAGARERQGMTNYTFVARVAFDGKNNEAYRGNASLSLVAHYTPGRGCYEARWEQIADHPKDKGNYVHDKKGNKGQRLVILKWSVDSTGKYTSKELKAWTNTVVSLQKSNAAGDNFQNDSTQSISNQKYLPMYISVSNTASSVVIWTGVRLGATAISGSAIQPDFTQSGDVWYSLKYTDNSNIHKNGTYGLLTANSEGIFMTPCFYDAAAVVSKEVGKDNTKSKVQLPAEAYSCRSDILDDYWYYQYGRMEKFNGTEGSNFGFRASPITQKLYVALRNPSYDGTESAWRTVWTNEFNSFGTSGSTLDFSKNLYLNDDSQIRFQVGGNVDDVRVDVVIDEIVVSQWRGDDWANAADYVNGGDNFIANGDSQYNFTNFTFSTSWIKDQGILLSARRTTGDRPSAIKSPLFDGMYRRGEGLGKFSFSWKNAQPNAKLLLQIATNINYTTASPANLDIHNDSIWHSISNFDFSVYSEEERKSGSRTVYTGLHGVQGMFRLVVDPTVVTNIAQSMNKDMFGEVLVTEVSCSDEPRIDERAWWGWNIRSVGQNADGADIDWERWDGYNAEGRTYLPDFSDNLAYAGRSMALNNSYKNPEARILPDGVSEEEEIVYERHMPFIQSPTFTEDIVGEVSFKARKFKTKNGPAAAKLVLYGARKGKTTDAADESWDALQTFSITNNAFETYSYKAGHGSTYSAFRLGVPLYGDNVERVIIDEFLVCEAVNAAVKFRNVGAFRNHMSDLTVIEGVPTPKEQPLCNESWGVQCEVYAAQLPDEVDFVARPPQVFLSWFKGMIPWGYENWKDYNAAQGKKKFRIPLTRAEGTNLVYRSTNLGLGDNVIPASTSAGEVVQYMLEVVYYNKADLTKPITNYLDNTMWRAPEWYTPIDYNRDKLTDNATFAAFNILDTVAPDWAWINEVNVFGMFDNVSDENTDATCQYVEIAAPVESALDDWEVRLLERADDVIVTNVAAKFGTDNLPAKKDSKWSTSNMVFHVIASPYTRNKKELTRENGKLDGVWSITKPGSVLGATGEASTIYPFAVQLVRPSGIIEHEIVVAGTNLWAEYEGFALNGDIDYVADRMNEIIKKTGKETSFFGAGYDNGPVDASLGVFESHGEKPAVWNNIMAQTPGRINANQQISSDHPTPNGEDIFIFSNLDQTLPFVKQTFGDVVKSNTNVMIVFKKGSLTGTNITYTVDKWYELKSVTTNGKEVVFAKLPESRTYSVEVGKGASNNVTVTAFAGVSAKLFDYGLSPDDPFTPAVMDWLVKGKDAFGNDWAHPESEDIELAKFVNYSGTIVTNLTLTQMYWLDIDPTKSNMYFKAGFSTVPQPKGGNSASAGNEIGTIYMCISNNSPEYAYEAVPPRVMRGRDVGSHSLNFVKSSDWNGPTFNVRGILSNGKTDFAHTSPNWVPLRWFVFNENSFYPKGHEKEFQSVIEIIDPRSSESPGSTAEWNKYPEFPVFYSWGINTKRQPIEVEPMKRENTYE